MLARIRNKRNRAVYDDVLILAYHRIADPVDDARTTTPTEFRQQIATLVGHGFTSITADSAVDARFDPSPGRRVAITFDDGYVETLENAAPILEEFGFVATVFVVTDWIGTAQNLKGAWRNFMSQSELRTLAERGYEIGSHTTSHRSLDILPRDEVRHELARSREVLSEVTGEPPDGFCYPRGDLLAWTPAEVSDTGYGYAVVTPRRFLGFETRFTTRRVGVYAHTSGLQFRMKISRFGRVLLEPGTVASIKGMPGRVRARLSLRH